MGKLLYVTPALDGARVLWRHWASAQPPNEGYIREFSPDKLIVRVSRTTGAFDVGSWWRAADLRVEAVLEQKQQEKEEQAPPGIPPKDSDFHGPEFFK